MAEVVLPADVKRTILFRQIGFLVGVAASVALGVYVVLWSQTPSYSLLYGSLSTQDISQVLDSLQKSGIEYRIDESSGAVMVPSGKIHDARLKLASDGLPKSANMGFGMLQEEQSIGTSQFIEQARYQHALENELARTIEKLSAIRTARVHLALSKQSAFIRHRKAASASVLLDLYSGHQLEAQQVAAISNLVAASVPNLDARHVSVVDQFGRLMTQGSGSDELIMSNNQFQYTRRVEASYVKRIEDILAPIVGSTGVKAEVAADFDFTSTEQTREMYNPDLPALRSEQIEEESMRGATASGGVPGALSNQPGVESSLSEVAREDNQTNVIADSSNSENSMQRRATRNYELDRTISHTRMPVGSLRRLSVAVLIDYKEGLGTDGKPTRVEHSPEEIEQITALVREAIGHNAARGDSVSVMNTEFARPEPIETPPAEPIWKEPWVWDVAKQVLGGIFVLFLVFGVLRPAIKNLVNKEVTIHQKVLAAAGPAAGELAVEGGEAGQQQLAGRSGEATKQISGPKYDSSVDAVKGVVQNDAKLAAQVVKNWVGGDD